MTRRKKAAEIPSISSRSPQGRARHLTTAVASLATGEVLGKVATLVTFAWSARLLGVDEFGLFTYALGIGILLATIPSLGLEARLVQLTGRDPRLLNEYLGPLMVVRLALAVAAFGAAVPFVLARDSTSARLTIILMVSAAVIDVMTDAQRSACVVLEQQQATAAVTVFQRALTLVAALVLLTVSPSTVSLAVAFNVAGLGACAAMTILARRHGARTEFRQFTWGRTKTILRAAPVMGVNEIVGEAVTRVDVILIQMILGDAAVGVYGVAYRLMETALFITWSVGHALAPDLVRAKDRDALGRAVGVGVVLMFIVYLPYGAILATRGQDLVDLLFGSGYQVGALLVFLAPAPLVFGLGQLARKALFARSPTPVVPIATASALVINIAMNGMLLDSGGLVWAAVAKTTAYAVQMLVMWALLVAVARVHGVVRGAAVAVGATAASVVLLTSGLPVVPALLSAGAAYGLVWVLLTRRFDPVMARRIRVLRGGRDADVRELEHVA